MTRTVRVYPDTFGEFHGLVEGLGRTHVDAMTAALEAFVDLGEAEIDRRILATSKARRAARTAAKAGL